MQRAAAPDSDDRTAGILWMVFAVASLSVMDAIGKKVAARHSVFQMLAIRSTVSLVVLAAILAASGQLGRLRTRQVGGHAMRAFCGLVAFSSFYAALRHLPLADAVAVAFGSPFLIAIAGRVLLNEPVGLRRWIAIAAGFGGMLMIVRPTGRGVEPASFLVLLAAVAYAWMMVLARWMTRPPRAEESTDAFVFYMLAGQAGAGWLIAAWSWVPPDSTTLWQMAVMGLLAILGNYGLVLAFRKAPVAAVAPFEYTGLLWAVVLGAMVFGDVPPASFWAGAAVIIGAGLYTLRAQ